MSHFSVAVFTETGTISEVESLLEPYQECYEHNEYSEFVEDNGCEFDEEAGARGYWENPNAKWDWYSIGGRWSEMLIPKCDGLQYKDDGVDSWLVKDIDFEAMERRALERLEPFETCFERRFYKKKYFDSMYPTEEVYIRKNTKFSTYAVVTPDGEWHSPGDVGWFGCSAASPDDESEFVSTYKERFIDPAIQNGWYLTIVDCHI